MLKDAFEVVVACIVMILGLCIMLGIWWCSMLFVSWILSPTDWTGEKKEKKKDDKRRKGDGNVSRRRN